MEPRKLLVRPKPKDIYGGSPSCPGRLSFCSVQLSHDSVNVYKITFTELILTQFYLCPPPRGSLGGGDDLPWPKIANWNATSQQNPPSYTWYVGVKVT